MNLGADMMRDKSQDAFAIARRQTLSGIGKSTRQPVDPEPTVGVEHDLDDFSVLKPKRDGRPQRGAQHACAARHRFLIEMMNCHLRPPTSLTNFGGCNFSRDVGDH